MTGYREKTQSAIDKVGDVVTLRRVVGQQQIPFDVSVRAVTAGFKPLELTGGIIQGDQSVIIGTREIQERQWPAPPRKGDVIVWASGRMATVEGCETVTVHDDVIRYNLTVRGAA